jgi:acyl-coenzyme A synthetase/AMP-(fatty) acid ligase
VQPAIKLVNAYGLTETSDDTNHEIMDQPPEGDRVPLGRPVNNVDIYVVDDDLRPVPMGEIGEIVFCGVCVGRGYINDVERTQRAFLPDPLHPGEGQRLYRSGDFGRCLENGKLEFLGRRDSQVKISGFRIEIGEIENALLRVPGVRAGAVVVHDDQLVAFYAADRPLDSTDLRDELGKALPPYMVPTVFHWRTALPLTANGKTDRKALAALAAELARAEPATREPPKTLTERRLAAAWAEVLGISQDQIGKGDSFFELGGVSLTALKLLIALDRAVSFKDLVSHPILADLARLLDDRGVGVGVQKSRVSASARSCAT